MLGPGDKPKSHVLRDEAAAASARTGSDSSGEEGSALSPQSLVMLPPSIRQYVHYLVLSVHFVGDLSVQDALSLSKGIDAYVKLAFNGKEVKTHVSHCDERAALLLFLCLTALLAVASPGDRLALRWAACFGLRL